CNLQSLSSLLFPPEDRMNFVARTGRAQSGCALSILSLAVASAVQLALPGALRANSGTQLPLSQYQAGSEATQSTPITNPGFEQPGVTGSTATGWTNIDDGGNPGTM